MNDMLLRVVGLGPGDAFLLTPQARAQCFKCLFSHSLIVSNSLLFDYFAVK